MGHREVREARRGDPDGLLRRSAPRNDTLRPQHDLSRSRAARCGIAPGAKTVNLRGVDSPLLPIIQLAITPVILISGMGALMLTMTNRMGRIVDRTRSLAGQVRSAPDEERGHLEGQLDIMWRRAVLIRQAVTFNGMSMLVACLLVIAIFANAVRGWRLEAVIMVLFAGSILLLIAALVMFLRDIFASLRALRLEVERARHSGKSAA